MPSGKQAKQTIAEVLAAARANPSEFNRLLDQAALQLTAEDWDRLDVQLAQEKSDWHSLSLQEALECLEGHIVLTVAGAVRVCRALNATFDPHLILRWRSAKAAREQFGIFDVPEGTGSGVSALTLSYSIAAQFGLGRPGSQFTGKGFQSRANRDAIALYLQKQAPSEDGK